MAARNVQRFYGSGSRAGTGKVVELSKALSWLLRHAVVKEGLQFQADGYVFVDDILRHPSFTKYTIDDVHECVEKNEKKRFGLKTDEITGKEMIRAHQGHSIQDLDIDMREITDPKEFPTVLHGTYRKHWSSICNKGLSKMGRQHVHFAPGLPKGAGVVSGMRASADLYIYIDMEKALNDGLKFFVSSNNVILSPGNENGCIPTRYFRLVEDRRGERISLPAESFERTTTDTR
ncbi:unnamed protein product [Adineta ricciae]|uniref:2'-phosphotransferase n=1 Tax=Adineta ricciae TaxID=249248 RepID=A0A815M4A3_ADIRI|nr:unnamed protein product [Adineta ricciae]